MEVKLDKQYPLAVDAERAWTILKDLKSVAGCMPGAEITEQLSESSYKGGVKVKVGLAVAQFGGTVDVLALQPEARRIELRGKGADKAGSSASMDLIATIVADPADPALSTLHGEATVIVNGKFAQFGGRMMVQVSDMILGQFVDNFRAAAAALPAPAGVAPVAAGAEAALAASPAAPAPAPQVAREINGLAIVWMLIKNWWLGLFGRRSG
jgi:carbon monoxide dehydrogenase subunit G